jgi:hypothetical protein
MFHLLQGLEKLPRIKKPFILQGEVQRAWNPTEMEFFYTQIVVKNLQACGLCDSKVPTNGLTQREGSFDKRRANCLGLPESACSTSLLLLA